MAPDYKLIYLNSRGRAELPRFILKYGGIEFEDLRIEKSDWPQWKNKMPFGQVPVLEHKGKTVGQSLAICRYLAKQVKLAGNDDWENLEIDAIADTITDWRSKFRPIIFEKDEAKKKTLLDSMKNETLPFYLKRFEEIAEKNKGYLAVGRLTWVDLYFAIGAPVLEEFCGPEVLTEYPNLKAIAKKVYEIPAIKKWIEIRPKSDT